MVTAMTYLVYVQGDLDTRPLVQPGWRAAPGPTSVYRIKVTGGDFLSYDRAGVWIDDTCYPWWRVVQIERVAER